MVKRFNTGLSAALKRRITHFDNATRSYAFIGNADVEDREAIEDHYIKTRQALEKAIVDTIKDRLMAEKVYDVVEVNYDERKVIAFMGQGKTLRNAEAIENMALARRGCEDSFYDVVEFGKYEIGDEYFQPDQVTE